MRPSPGVLGVVREGLVSDFPRAGDEFGWRRRHLAGVLRLRPPIAQHSEGECCFLRRYADGARCAVEIGVAEGGSARWIREAIDPGGTLFLIDPYPPGRLGISLARLIARRHVGEIARGHVVWIRKPSAEAAKGWDREIDFLFIDADNSFEGVSRDWRDWSPRVRVGGTAVIGGGRTGAGSWVPPDHGPARLVSGVVAEAQNWEIVDGTESVLAVRRTG